MFSVHQQTIRLYEKEGFINPKRSDGNTRLFSEEDIPWSELAFPIVTDVLTEYFEDRKTGEFPIRVSTPSKLWAKHVGWKPTPEGKI